MEYSELMTAAAYEALDNFWPFSSIDTREVRYFGKDKAVLKMIVAQILATAKGAR